jgi:hypothetical protein
MTQEEFAAEWARDEPWYDVMGEASTVAYVRTDPILTREEAHGVRQEIAEMARSAPDPAAYKPGIFVPTRFPGGEYDIIDPEEEEAEAEREEERARSEGREVEHAGSKSQGEVSKSDPVGHLGKAEEGDRRPAILAKEDAEADAEAGSTEAAALRRRMYTVSGPVERSSSDGGGARALTAMPSKGGAGGGGGGGGGGGEDVGKVD